MSFLAVFGHILLAQATKTEYSKVSDPNFEKKRKRSEWLEYQASTMRTVRVHTRPLCVDGATVSQARKQRDMEKRGRTAEDAYLDQSGTRLCGGIVAEHCCFVLLTPTRADVLPSDPALASVPEAG